MGISKVARCTAHARGGMVEGEVGAMYGWGGGVAAERGESKGELRASAARQ